MNKLHIFSGIPASGKSTTAIELQKTQRGKLKRVNRDTLRLMLDLSEWSPKNEKLIKSARDFLIEDSLKRGFDVISDDTNLSAKNNNGLLAIAKRVGGVQVINKFFPIDLKTAIKRDEGREDKVGKGIVTDFYNKYIKNGRFKQIDTQYFPVIVNTSDALLPYNPDLPDCIICDIDGTLSHMTDRSPYDGEACASDILDAAVSNVLHTYKMAYADLTEELRPKIFLFSGRNGESEPQTRAWLKANHVPFDELHMREKGNFQKDCIIKGKMLDEQIIGKYNVLFMLDDREQVVDYYRSRGLKVFAVAEGKF